MCGSPTVGYRHAVKKVYLRSLQGILRNTIEPSQIISIIVNLCQPRNLDEANHFAQLMTERDCSGRRPRRLIPRAGDGAASVDA